MKKATLGKAIADVALAFRDVTDRGGRPYIEHCLRVMEAGRHLGDEVMMAFVMHDLLEDCPEWSRERMLNEGYSELTTRIVVCMTRIDGEPYGEYIERISRDEYAVIGKRADLKDNMDLTRLKKVREKDLDRVQKYDLAYQYLKD